MAINARKIKKKLFIFGLTFIAINGCVIILYNLGRPRDHEIRVWCRNLSLVKKNIFHIIYIYIRRVPTAPAQLAYVKMVSCERIVKDNGKILVLQLSLPP